MAIEWTAEEIAKRPDKEVKALRDNAARHGSAEIVALCDAELQRRNPPRIKRKPKEGGEESREGQYVCEFHFVCPTDTELGITRNHDGTIWTGTWVVAASNAEDAQRYGSLVALHSARAELSYLQGTIKAWRRSLREPKYAEGQLVKTEFGIDFLFEPNNAPGPLERRRSSGKRICLGAYSHRLGAEP